MTKNNDDIVTVLKSIDKKLDILINLSRLSAPKQTVTSEEKKIFDLCNKKNTAPEMVIKTTKTLSNVNFILNSLRNKGLIKSVKNIKKQTVYSKV